MPQLWEAACVRGGLTHATRADRPLSELGRELLGTLRPGPAGTLALRPWCTPKLGFGPDLALVNPPIPSTVERRRCALGS